MIYFLYLFKPVSFVERELAVIDVCSLFWIFDQILMGYGHHHYNTPDFFIGNTRLVTNQLGYVEHRENSLFSTGRYIDMSLKFE